MQGSPVDGAINRRSMLALAAAGLVTASMPSCIVINKNKASSESEDDEVPDTNNYGYNGTAGEGHSTAPKAHQGALPTKASVKTEWLPPVGDQGNVGSCFIWASVYGLATYYAASKKQKAPKSSDLQAAPVYSYIHYEAANKTATNTCNGGQIGKALDWLRANGGTPTLATAPNGKQGPKTACQSDWSTYQSKTVAPDASFNIPAYQVTQINGSDGLKNIRTVIASGVPIGFGTCLYTDFKPYKGNPKPYVGNGTILIENGQKSAHAMMIVGYDDNYQSSKGAVQVQNSWGKKWGDKGFIWIAYDTFEKLVQGQGVYIPSGG
jgi:hypothetical protein